MKIESTPYISKQTSTDITNSLEQYSVKLFKWVSMNQMKQVPDMFLLVMSTGTDNLFLVGNYMVKVNNSTSARCEICLKLMMKTPQRRQWRHSGGFIVNFEHILHLILVFLLLTLSR